MDFVRKHRLLMVIALFALMATCCASECSDFVEALTDLLSDGFSPDIAVPVAGAKVAALSNSDMQHLARAGGAQTAKQSDHYEHERQYRSRRGWREVQRYSRDLDARQLANLRRDQRTNENGPASAYGQSSDDRTECRTGADCRG